MENRRYKLVFLLLSLGFLSSCYASEYTAYYNVNDTTRILIVLSNKHPFFAEYNRELMLSHNEKIFRQKLFPDTGGYTDANLYLCSKGKYMISGYFDSWTIDISSSTITNGKCTEDALKYLGVFSWGIEKFWGFYEGSVYKEKQLKSRGG